MSFLKILLLSSLLLLIGGCDFGKKEDISEKLQSTLRPENVRYTIKNNKKLIKSCYDTAIKNYKDLTIIKIVFFWKINKNGKAQDIEVIERSTKEYVSLENCIKEKIQKISFPKFKKNEIFEVKYPFAFDRH